MTAFEALRAEAITLRDYSPGTRKTTCPKCSASRRNKTDPCLSVTISVPDECVWHCHHCAWSGGWSARRDVPAFVPRTPAPKRNRGAEWRKKFTSERRW